MRTLTRIIATGLLALSAAGAASCNLIAPVIAVAHGAPKIQKAFDLDASKTTVVLVEDTSSPPQVRDSRLIRKIAQAATAELTRVGAVRTAVDPGPIHMMSLQPSERQTPIAELARRVGADQIIYAQIIGFTLSPDGQTFTPTAELRVKVLDAGADGEETIGKRLWPADAEGHPLIAGGESISGFSPRDAADIRQAELELADLTGLRLAQLFFDRERDAVSRNRPGG